MIMAVTLFTLSSHSLFSLDISSVTNQIAIEIISTSLDIKNRHIEVDSASQINYFMICPTVYCTQCVEHVSAYNSHHNRIMSIIYENQNYSIAAKRSTIQDLQKKCGKSAIVYFLDTEVLKKHNLIKGNAPIIIEYRINGNSSFIPYDVYINN